MPMTPLLVADFAAAFLYLEVHAAFDEIRGQIGVPPAVPTTGTIRVVEQTSPPGGAGFGFDTDIPGGPVSFTLDDGQTQTFAGVAPGVYSVSQDDPQVTPGGYALTGISCDGAGSSIDPFSRTATIDLPAGAVLTCTFQDFQTAPTDQTFLFHLEGAQEVPPVGSSANGGCFGAFDAGASELSLLCVHDVSGATVMHIHRGAAGTNGPIVFDLGTPTEIVQATWSGMTPSDVADLLAGNLYLNIHTSGRPDGEIRGQILARTVDTIEFPVDASQVVPPGTSSAMGSCVADLDAPGTTLSVQCTHDLPLPTAASLHEGPPGATGPLVFTFPSAASPLSGNVPTAPRLLADFAAGFLYLEIAAGDPGNEGDPSDVIRGQLGDAPLQPVASAIPTLGGLALAFFVLALGAAAWRTLTRAR
jgi:hypothetical protein